MFRVSAQVAICCFCHHQCRYLVLLSQPAAAESSAATAVCVCVAKMFTLLALASTCNSAESTDTKVFHLGGPLPVALTGQVLGVGCEAAQQVAQL